MGGQLERIFGGNLPYNFICVWLMVVPQVVDMCKIRSFQQVGTLSIVRLFLQLLLLSIFLYFFGLPAIGKYFKQDVMVVEMKIDTGGIPLPAITISGSAASDIPCFSRNLTTSCIEANTYNLSQNLKDIILGYTRKESVSLDRKVLSEDFTSFFAGRHVTTLSTCPWLLGLTTPWTSFSFCSHQDWCEFIYTIQDFTSSIKILPDPQWSGCNLM